MAKPGPRKNPSTSRKRKVRVQTKRVEGALAKLDDAKVERRGGARIGAGRKPGGQSIARRILGVREITSDIIKSGKVPLRVMINNMLFYDEKAGFLEEAFANSITEMTLSPEHLLKAMELFTQIGDARMKAQKCACDAAPFIHPKLSQISMDVTRNDHQRDLREEDDIDTFRDRYNEMRQQALTLDNDTGAPVDEDEDA